MTAGGETAPAEGMALGGAGPGGVWVIFAKTGADRQAALTRLVLTLFLQIERG